MRVFTSHPKTPTNDTMRRFTCPIHFCSSLSLFFPHLFARWACKAVPTYFFSAVCRSRMQFYCRAFSSSPFHRFCALNSMKKAGNNVSRIDDFSSFVFGISELCLRIDAFSAFRQKREMSEVECRALGSEIKIKTSRTDPTPPQFVNFFQEITQATWKFTV